MRIENEFVVHAPVDRAWQVLTDLPLIAPCVPGARLTGVEDGVYSGRVKIKVGPVVQEFAGTARFVTKDDVGHVAVIDAKGKDARGAGNASAVVTARLRADGDSTVATVETEMKLSGKIAQLGGGMIKEVSEKLLAAFVASLETTMAEVGRDSGPTVTPPTVTPPADSSPTTPAPTTLAPTEAPSTDSASTPPEPAAAGSWAARSGAAGSAPGAPTRATPAEPEPLDVLALAGGSIARRAAPAGIAVALVVLGLVVWLVTRRRR